MYLAMRWRWSAGVLLAAVVATVVASASGDSQMAAQSLPGLVAPGPNACLPGTGSRNWCGDAGPATRAKLAGPEDMALAADGSLVIADTGNNVIRRVTPDGVIGTLAGDGAIPRRAPRAVEPAARPRFDRPSGVAVAPDGSVLVADTGNDAIRRITADGKVRIVLGGRQRLGARLSGPQDVVALPNGDLLVADTFGHRVLRLTASGAVAVVAGTGVRGVGGDGGPATDAPLGEPVQLAPLPDGGLLIADERTGLVRRVDAGGIISTAASVTDELLAGVALAPDGAVLATLSAQPGGRAPTRILRFDPSGSSIAGTGRDGFNGDGPASATRLSRPRQLVIAPDGSLLIAEPGNDRIRRLTADGRLVSVAGSDQPRPDVPSVPQSDDGGGGAPGPPMGGGGGEGPGEDVPACFDPHPKFRTFNFIPALDRTLKVGRKVKVRVQTSVTAQVVVRLEFGGERLATRTKRARNDRSVTAVKLSAKLGKGARYVIEMEGRALNESRIKRCDRRFIRLR